MAKDQDKLLRQLSLISYLMAERRPVSALAIRRDVEGYTTMNEDAFARRFYADRMELCSLGVDITMQRAPDCGRDDAETYQLRPEAFHLPQIAFTDGELAALQMTLSLLDGEFAYAEPLRLALQQLAFGRPNPLADENQQSVWLAVQGSAGDADAQQRLARVEHAIFRHKTVVFDYYSIQRDTVDERAVDPYNILYWGGEFLVLGRCHSSDSVQAFRIKRIRGKISYLTKAEHDYTSVPADFDPRHYANRASWQLGDCEQTARILISDRIAWQIERQYRRYGTVETLTGGRVVFDTEYADARALATWVLGLGEHAVVLDPPDLTDEVTSRMKLLADRHRDSAGRGPSLPVAERVTTCGEPEEMALGAAATRRSADRSATIRPERFARLTALAGLLIAAGRAGDTLQVADLCETMQVSDRELREDIDVLNIVNFGGGTYLFYADVDGGNVTVDTEAYADAFERPARLMPTEARALIAALDLVGDHLDSDGTLASAKAKILEALGRDPKEYLHVASQAGDDSDIARVCSAAIATRQILRLDYYKPNEDEFTTRRVEPYALVNGTEGWYVATYDPARDDMRHFRLDRIRHAEVTDETFAPRDDVDPAAQLDGWLTTGEVRESLIARVWVSPERARWAREERKVLDELADGAVIVEVAFKSLAFLIRDVLADGGDAAVLAPQNAREAVYEAVQRLKKAKRPRKPATRRAAPTTDTHRKQAA